MTEAASNPRASSQPEPLLSREVLEGLRDQEEGALAAFFDTYFDRVYGYVRRLVGEEHLAEDLTQDIFLHVYRSLPSYDPTRDLRPWVFTIATNKVRDFWRSRRHQEAQREKSVDVEGAADSIAGPAANPDASLTREEMDEEVRRAVDSLPDGMRATLVLRVYEGLSFEAIGRIIDRNEVAVRKRYSRALDQLRQSLGKAWEIFAEGS